MRVGSRVAKLGAVDKRVRWLAVLVWMLVIFAFSHQPYSGRESEKVLHDYNVPVRKAGHITEYLVLFVLVRWAIDCPRVKSTSKKAANENSEKFVDEIGEESVEEIGEKSIDEFGKEPATAGGAPPGSEVTTTIATRFLPPGVIAFLTSIFYAGLDEWHQSYVPGRSATLSDVAVDTCGIILGVVLWAAVNRSFLYGKGTTDS